MTWFRAQRGEQDAQILDVMSERAAADRLLRLQQRAEKVASAVEENSDRPSALSAAHLQRSTLATNPFAVLEVDLAASAAEVAYAHETLSFEPGRDPVALHAARAVLQNPRDRLAAEIGWLPGLMLASADGVRKALRSDDQSTLMVVREKTAGFARMNLSFALLEVSGLDPNLAARLFQDARKADPVTLLDQLDDARFRSGTRQVDRDQFNRALDVAAAAIGARLAEAFTSSASARRLLAQLLEELPAPGTCFGERVCDEVLRGYVNAVEGTMEETRLRALATAEALRSQPDSEAQATTLVTALDVWSSLRRPLQLQEAARGLDDPASADLCRALRSLVVQLSNENEQYNIALRVARALLACFRLVPTHHAQLQRELPVLVGNVLARRARQLHDRGLEHWRTFADAIEAGGLDRASGIAGALAGLMEEADDHADQEIRAAVFMTVRNLAVLLHNQQRRVRAARILTVWLAERVPPPDVAVRLAADLRHFGLSSAVLARKSATEAAAQERWAGHTGGGSRPAAASVPTTEEPVTAGAIERPRLPRGGSRLVGAAATTQRPFTRPYVVERPLLQRSAKHSRRSGLQRYVLGSLLVSSAILSKWLVHQSLPSTSVHHVLHEQSDTPESSMP